MQKGHGFARKSGRCASFRPRAGALFAFALFSSPEAHEWYWFARGGAGYTWKERDRTKQNRRTNDKRLFCFVSFTKCLCTPLFVCTHLRLSCSSSTSPEPLSGRVSSDIWGRSPVSPSTYLLVSARGYIRRAGYPLLAPLRRQERTVALTIPASYGASLGCSSGCSPERGWAFRKSGMCSQALSKTNDRTALRSSVLRIALSPLFDSSHLTSRSFTVRVPALSNASAIRLSQVTSFGPSAYLPCSSLSSARSIPLRVEEAYPERAGWQWGGSSPVSAGHSFVPLLQSVLWSYP